MFSVAALLLSLHHLHDRSVQHACLQEFSWPFQRCFCHSLCGWYRLYVLLSRSIVLIFRSSLERDVHSQSSAGSHCFILGSGHWTKADDLLDLCTQNLAIGFLRTSNGAVVECQLNTAGNRRVVPLERHQIIVEKQCNLCRGVPLRPERLLLSFVGFSRFELNKRSSTSRLRSRLCVHNSRLARSPAS